MVKIVYVLFLLCAVFSVNAQYKYSGELSPHSKGLPFYHALEGIAIDSFGNVYVVDWLTNKVIIVDSTGKSIQIVGQNSLTNPYDIALDSFGNIYVANLGNGNMVKFDKAGNVVLSIPDSNPIAIAVDKYENSYIINYDKYIVTKYNKNGVKTKSIGGAGTIDGTFTGIPKGIALDNNNNIYISAGNQVHKFDSAGTFLFRFGAQGTSDGEFQGASGLVINKINGDIIVSDLYNHRIQIFSNTGVFLRKFGTKGTADGKLYFPVNVALDRYNNIHIVESFKGSGYSALGRVQKYNYAGDFIRRTGIRGDEDSLFYYPIDVRTDSINNIYVLDAAKYCVLKYDSLGKFLLKIGERGTSNGQLSKPSGLRLDKNGYLYIWDETLPNSVIQRFKPNGTFDSIWEKTTSDTIFKEANYITYDSYGNKFISDYEFVYKYNAKDIRTSTIVKHGHDSSFEGICFDKNKKLYVASSGYGTIQFYEPTPRIKIKDTGNSIDSNYSYNFGSCQPLDTLYKEFVIENVGNKDLLLSSIDFVSPNPAFILYNTHTNYTIAHDDSTKILVKFSPKNMGNQADSIKIVSNDCLESTFTYGLEGTTKAVLNVRLDGIQYNYGGAFLLKMTPFESTKKVTVTVENLGFENLIIDSIICIISCDYFSVDKNNFSPSIPAFSSSTFDIVYSALNSTVKVTQIVIYSNDEVQPVFLVSPIGMVVAGVEDATSINSTLTLFPNPATQNLTINSTYTIQQIKVLDVLGKEVMNLNNIGTTQLDISTLPKGLYNFVITTDRGVGSKKVSVQ